MKDKELKAYNIAVTARYTKKFPWTRSYFSSKARCNNPNDPHYNYYGGKGIKLLMSMEDFKFLWFRDKAFLLDSPSVDRIDSNDNYTIGNCRYIERSENSRRANTGMDNKRSKLTDKDVLEIRSTPLEIMGIDLAIKYGVSSTAIYFARQGKTWKHL